MSEEKMKFGCIMLDIPGMEQPIAKWKNENLDPNKINDEHGTDGHITLIYGLKDYVKPEHAANILKNWGKPITIRIGELQIFENDQDVIHASIVSPELYELRKMIEKLPNEDEHPVYKPHMTIAYVASGYGKYFVGKKPFDGTYTITKATFSTKDKERTIIKFADDPNVQK